MPTLRLQPHRPRSACGLLKAPPRGSQLDGGSQVVPFQALWNISPLVHRPKTSRRLLPQEATAGGLQAAARMGSLTDAGVQACAFQVLWNISPLVPRPKTSRRLLPQEATAVALRSTLDAGRSEERRVGKERRSRWSPYH